MKRSSLATRISIIAGSAKINLFYAGIMLIIAVIYWVLYARGIRGGVRLAMAILFSVLCACFLLLYFVMRGQEKRNK